MNNDYSFDSFVSDSTNSQALSIALEVAARSRQQGIIFIHGPASSGKTHLLYAIAHELGTGKGTLRKITAEDFTNAYRRADQAGGIDKFRRGIEKIDLLLVDDVHFFRTRKLALGEFLHTCQEFQRSGKLMVLTGRRSPAEFHLAEPMEHMFSTAIVCEIELPEPETRVRIIQDRLLSEGLSQLPDEVANYLANFSEYKIAQLIGAARNILLRCELAKVAPSVQLAKQQLSGLTKSTNIDHILLCVGRRYGITNITTLVESWDERHVRARNLAAYLAVEAGISRRQIATSLQTNPSSVSKMVAQVDQACQTEGATTDLVLQLADEIDD